MCQIVATNPKPRVFRKKNKTITLIGDGTFALIAYREILEETPAVH